jgi:hypothetical protein
VEARDVGARDLREVARGMGAPGRKAF